MLTRIQASRFRSLYHVEVGLSRHHVLVGPNGAGKSTFLDTVAFVSDFVRFGAQAATVGDDRFHLEPRVNRPRQMLTHEEGNRFQLALEAARERDDGTLQRCRYELEMQVENGEMGVSIERFLVLDREAPTDGAPATREFPFVTDALSPVVQPKRAAPPLGRRQVIAHFGDTGAANYNAEVGTWRNTQRPPSGSSALGMLTNDPAKFPLAIWFRNLLLEGSSRLAINGPRLRLPAPAGAFRGLSADGANLANAVGALRAADDTALFREWVDEVRTAIPDLADIRTVEREEDRRRYVVARFTGGHEVPSFTMSDGTLRLLLLTLIQFLPNAPALLLVEEPENGIHPRGIETVYRGLKNVRGQVLCATHSPVVVNQAALEQILCVGKTPAGYTDVVAGHRRGELKSWLSTVDKGTLFATGVL